MTRRTRLPSPARHEPVLPAPLALALYIISSIAVAVIGGGALSGLLAGHRPALVPPTQLGAIMVRLAADPAHPATAWLQDPRPGPAWLTWICMAAMGISWCTGLAIGSELAACYQRRRITDGLAGRTDLRRSGLDARSAAEKATAEYPELARRGSSRHRTGGWKWWRR
ncbi:hypothetical protein [Nocardia aurantia]|uniref:Uncharacterized protein n=1 Tax=Nocardia aurantia TaxID=2585199 RepID=A0A7K0DTP6_9NOCA|nr:hypothetical protein [Nocardia aurantia]MQY28907.1 hypothetical protein [Nocardia aurantia]